MLKSFLVNKVPLLLCQLFSPQFSTTSSEFCITEALNRVDTSVFPTASLMFDESRSNNPYTESVREEFCTACALHGLVQREHVERILGETSMSYEPSLEKLSKDKLVQDCLSDSEKIQGLVRDLDKMDGNVGAMCQALVEVHCPLSQDDDGIVDANAQADNSPTLQHQGDGVFTGIVQRVGAKAPVPRHPTAL